MGEYVIKLPDVGEGVAEAELVEWNVKIGDLVREDMVLAAVMTDKATVEIPSPVDGEIIWLGGEIGQVLAIGSPLVRLKIDGEGHAAEPEPAKPAEAEAAPAPKLEQKEEAPKAQEERSQSQSPQQQRKRLLRGLSASALRAARAKSRWRRRPFACGRARPASTCVRSAAPGQPGGSLMKTSRRTSRAALRNQVIAALAPDTSVKEVKVVGLRRKIAEKMAIAKSHIPHITYVEEIDVTSLEELRATLNSKKRADQPKLTILPFLMRAMVKAIADQPQLNALYDDEANVIHQHGGVHIGIAAQTPNGLGCSGGQACRSAHALGLRRRGQSAGGCGEDRHGDARTTQRLNDHHHVARQHGRRGDDAGHQLPGSGDHRRQQDHGAPGLGWNELHPAQDDEPVVKLRPPGHRWLGCGSLHPADQDAA